MVKSFSRRTVLKGTVAALGVAALPATKVWSAPAEWVATPAGLVPARFNVNGREVALHLDPRTTLLDALREKLDLTGTKVGCNQGTCGACTVHVDGRRVLACLTLGVAVEGRMVTTIEGLKSADGELHPMQRAFVERDALQCGYCTPGQIMSAVACVHEGHADSDDDIREYMSGNLCRCAAYPNIVAAVRDAAVEMKA